jgi:catechol 2,3-dioxygenase-like lactoylglutathione lyase family enzyme
MHLPIEGPSRPIATVARSNARWTVPIDRILSYWYCLGMTAFCHLRTVHQRHHGGCDMDWKLELVSVPVSDVDRSKAFYADKVGFNLDHDHHVNEGLRFVQLTPSGSACSIAIGTGITDKAPGSVAGLQLVVADADAARAELVGRGVDASEIQEFPWGRFVFFSDPDGNGWAVQEISGARTTA